MGRKGDIKLGNYCQQLPSSVIIVGAGIFGLSTALAITKRSSSTTVTVIERTEPPVPDGSSVDTTRCIRSDYTNPIYARLARESQVRIEADPDINQFSFRQGMTFVCDGQPGRFTDLWTTQKEAVRDANRGKHMVDLPNRDAVFRLIHGDKAYPPAPDNLVNGDTRWNVAYCNQRNSFIDAEACMKVYYERCLREDRISFQCGSAVDRITVESGICNGVILDDGCIFNADLVIVAAGAWSNKLVYLDERVTPIAHEVAWIKVTPEEQNCWRNMPITTNLSTGFNMFPPYHGEIKILRRSPGYKNTVSIPHPEQPSEIIQISHPRTNITHPKDVIPAEAERAMRENLREIMPSLANRPFDRTKLCWISTTPTGDFLIASHPRIAGVHLATGGSAHAWKFLPVIGDLVVDSIQNILSPELAKMWAFEGRAVPQDTNAPRMDGKPQELSHVVRNASELSQERREYQFDSEVETTSL